MLVLRKILHTYLMQGSLPRYLSLENSEDSYVYFRLAFSI